MKKTKKLGVIFASIIAAVMMFASVFTIIPKATNTAHAYTSLTGVSFNAETGVLSWQPVVNEADLISADDNEEIFYRINFTDAQNNLVLNYAGYEVNVTVPADGQSGYSWNIREELAESQCKSGTYTYHLYLSAIEDESYVSAYSSTNKLADEVTGEITYTSLGSISAPVDVKWDGAYATWKDPENSALTYNTDYYYVIECYYASTHSKIGQSSSPIEYDETTKTYKVYYKSKITSGVSYIFGVKAVPKKSREKQGYTNSTEVFSDSKNFAGTQLKNVNIDFDSILTFDAVPNAAHYVFRFLGDGDAYKTTIETTEPIIDLDTRLEANAGTATRSQIRKIVIWVYDSNYTPLTFEYAINWRYHVAANPMNLSEDNVAEGVNITSTYFPSNATQHKDVIIVYGETKIRLNYLVVEALGATSTERTFTYTTSNNVEELNIAGAKEIINISLTGFDADHLVENGKALVEIPFTTTIPEGKVAKVYYIDGNGNKTDMNATFKDGKATFIVPHFSTYVIVFEDKEPVTETAPAETPAPAPEETPAPAKKGLSGGAIAGIVIASVVVAAVGGCAIFWFVIKKKTWSDFVALFKKK